MNAISNRLYKILFICLIFIFAERPAYSQFSLEEPGISSVFRNIAELTDSTMIQFILDDFLIAQDISEIDKIEIIDVTNIGFGSNDLMVIHPSREIYILSSPQSADLLQHMLSWRIVDQRRDADNSLSPDFFNPGIIFDNEADDGQQTQIERVQNALISDVLESLNRNYQDMPISFRFERDGEGFTFQLWNYNEEAFSYTPKPSAIADTVFVDQIIEKEILVESEPEFILATGEYQSWRSGLSASILSSYLNNDVFKSNYTNGIGIQLQYDFERNFMLYRVGTGLIYHSVRQDNPFFDDQRQATNLFLLGMVGLKYKLDPLPSIYLGIGGRSSSYFYLENWASAKSQSFSVVYSEIGIEIFGVTLFGRHSLLTRPAKQRIIEGGLSLNLF